MGVATFSVAMLSGAGVDVLRSRNGHARFWLVGAVLCAGAGLVLSTDVVGTVVATYLGTPVPLTTLVTGSAARAFLLSAIATLGVAIVVTALKRGMFRWEVSLAILVAIVMLDLSRANQGVYKTGPAETATFVPPLAKAIQAQEGPPAPGRFRLFSIGEPVVVWPKDLMHSLGYYGTKSVERRQALDLEHNAQLHLETLAPYLPGYSTEFAVMANAAMERGSGTAAAARFNVSYYIGRRYHLDDPRLAQVRITELPDYDLALFRNPVPAKPRAYLSQRPERAAAPVDPAALIGRPDFLDGQVDVIEAPATTLPGPVPDGAAVIEGYAPEEVRIRVETPQSAVLVLLDAFEKGWTATLENGLELPILRANALVRAVVVPAGLHLVTFRYQTPLLLAGAVVSLLGCAVCVALLVGARRGRRAQTSRP